MNKIQVNFTPCSPAPSRGYNIKFWVAGSGSVPINAGNFFVSPAIFYDNTNPAGTQYEGFIKSDCGGESNQVYWSTINGCTESEVGDNIIGGTVIHTARGIHIETDQAIPCDVSFPILGLMDNGGDEEEFFAYVTVLAGQTSGSNFAATGSHAVIICLKPNEAPNIFSFEVSCGGVNYVFKLIIDNPC